MKKRIAYFSLAGLAMLAIWYFAVLVPMSAKADAIERSIEEVERRLEDYNQTCLDLPKYLEANEGLETLRLKLNSSLFAKGDILELFQQLAHDASHYDLRLTEISPPVSELIKLNRQALVDNEPQFLTVQLDLNGRYVALGRFVEHLEAQPYFRAINTCMIRGQQERQTSVHMTIAFKALLGSMEASS